MFTRRNLIRLILFIAAAVFSLGFVPDAWQRGRVVLPALSPLLNLGGALAARTAGVMTLLGLPLLILPFFKGRFFCWRICPMGFAAETVSRINRRNTGWLRRIPFIGKYLAPAILVSAAAGYPLLIWTDPLCMFNGFFSAWREPLTWLSAVTGIGFTAILLISLIVPNIWCHRLCPLGGLEELLTGLAAWLRARRAARTGAAAPADTGPAIGRRVFLGAAIGGGAGLACTRIKPVADRYVTFIRPPGAMDKAFNALCARCGNCMKACPYGLITPDLGRSGLDGLFTPVLAFRSRNEDQENFCFQDCNACSQVCPTGALRPLTIVQKQQTAIGVAHVCKRKCIAWRKHEYCVVCQEYCPYQAIVTVDRHGVKCPIVDESKCRGCGACESQCPAQPIAISVRGRHPQLALTAPSPQQLSN